MEHLLHLALMIRLCECGGSPMGRLLPVHLLAILVRLCQLGTHRMGHESSLALGIGRCECGMYPSGSRPTMATFLPNRTRVKCRCVMCRMAPPSRPHPTYGFPARYLPQHFPKFVRKDNGTVAAGPFDPIPRMLRFTDSAYLCKLERPFSAYVPPGMARLTTLQYARMAHFLRPLTTMPSLIVAYESGVRPRLFWSSGLLPVPLPLQDQVRLFPTFTMDVVSIGMGG
ncbi:hypothetical protein AG1IA_09984 [Rhizoctonia solani AG-1 IA]|uniref:Secreted protein n=1 Tax=Thanatephorus cucumeris (strain AG1-IA) TaxID=983506 RepID=L8WCT4_THACA|nr:hypothetical protein AG1IA_09984 [Rhizoctonia solani AG-1 IA]